jgi:hypothetical protein
MLVGAIPTRTNPIMLLSGVFYSRVPIPFREKMSKQNLQEAQVSSQNIRHRYLIRWISAFTVVQLCQIL